MTNLAMEPLVENAWYIGAWSRELDDGPIARRILGEDVVLFRDRSGQAAILEDRCCHRAVKLSLGRTVEQGLQCGYHGMVFDAKGACVVNPGGKPLPSYCVRAFVAIERQQIVWVWMGDASLADPALIVDFPYLAMPELWNFHFARYDIAANYMFLVDNLMDLTHLGYVHTSTIGGNPDEHDEAELITTRTERGAHYVRWMMSSTPPPAFVNAGGFTGDVDRWGDFEYVAPSSVLQWAGAHDAGTGGRENRDKAGGLVLRLFHHATPVDDENFHYFFCTAVRGQALDGRANVAFHDAVLEAFLEDKVFIESQQVVVSKDPRRPLLLRHHDKAVSFARQAIHALHEPPREVAE